MNISPNKAIYKVSVRHPICIMISDSRAGGKAEKGLLPVSGPGRCSDHAGICRGPLPLVLDSQSEDLFINLTNEMSVP